MGGYGTAAVSARTLIYSPFRRLRLFKSMKMLRFSIYLKNVKPWDCVILI